LLRRRRFGEGVFTVGAGDPQPLFFEIRDFFEGFLNFVYFQGVNWQKK
jgi:hypothetical protein